jgi:hypothetical protein
MEEPLDTPEWYNGLPLVDMERECEWKQIRILGGLKAADVARRGTGRARDGKPACVMDDSYKFFALPTCMWPLALRAIKVPYSTEGLPATIETTLENMLQHAKVASQHSLTRDLGSKEEMIPESLESAKVAPDAQSPEGSTSNNESNKHEGNRISEGLCFW